MSILTRAIQRRMLDRIDAALGLATRPGSRSAGGSLMSRLAAAGVLRLALRWPALSVLLIVSVVAARLMARRPSQVGEEPPVLRAP